MIDSGKGLMSFIKIFLLIYPKLRDKLIIIPVSFNIGSKYVYSYNKLNIINIEKYLKINKVKYIYLNFKFNKYIGDILYTEAYENRCLISLPLPKINKKINKIYESNLTKCNLVRFYIIYRFKNIK